MQEVSYYSKTFALWLTPDQIQKRVQELAEAINAAYWDKDVEIISILQGAFVFTADLIRQLDFHPRVHFIKASSYSGMQTTGTVQIDHIGHLNLEGKHVLICEDIIDTGRTLVEVLRVLRQANPATCEICSLLLKPDCLESLIDIKYCGFEIPPEFVVGYGLDFEGFGRNLPGIYRLKS